MRFALGPHPVDLEPASLLALAAAAEDAGFDSLWLAEDRDRPGGGGGLATAAFLAQRTCLAVGVLVDLGPRHPLRLAEEAAVADLCCGGRLELGVRPGPAAAEALGLLMTALTGRALQWRGDALRTPAGLPENGPVPAALALNPRPLQARLPVWLVGGDASLRATAAALGCGLVSPWDDRDLHIAAPVPGALPHGLLCPGQAQPEALAVAGERGVAYFLVQASAADALDGSRRLLPPLRMPELPPWVLADRDS